MSLWYKAGSGLLLIWCDDCPCPSSSSGSAGSSGNCCSDNLPTEISVELTGGFTASLTATHQPGTEVWVTEEFTSGGYTYQVSLSCSDGNPASMYYAIACKVSQESATGAQQFPCDGTINLTDEITYDYTGCGGSITFTITISA